MSLRLYNKKRNFQETPEPFGKKRQTVRRLAFVIQRHKASHLHYDFRLEMAGVLKSWAIPKGPSLNPKDKRLAMMTEDHPYNYKDFEGVIPEGNYGAGIVEIWDSGFYSDIDNSEKTAAEKKLKAGLKSGSLKFRLYGKKLKGEFALVRLKGKEDNSWLLIKPDDEYAVHEEYNSEDYTPKDSPINEWLAKNRPAEKVGAKSASNGKQKTKAHSSPEGKKLRNHIPPMLAKETESPFDDQEWIFEIKWDGYRAIAEVDNKNVLLYSRSGNTFNDSYPVIVEALSRLNIHAVLDGEIVVLDENGLPSFQLLQNYNYEYPLIYYVFDLLYVEGKNICSLPLLERKRTLKQLLKKNESVKYSDHIEKSGIDFFDAAGKKGLEGIMAKKKDSLYYSGVRTGNWLKIKHNKAQEAIIAGFTKPRGSRKYFGALVLGVKDGDRLKYIGHTGSGFNTQSLKKISELLEPLIQEESPFDEPVKTNMPATWVKPVLVCEVKYTEITHDGRLRHPIFMRLRDDKNAKEVTMPDIKRLKTADGKTQKQNPSKKESKSPVKEIRLRRKKNAKEISFGKIKVKITNRNKIFWPEEGLTKGDVIDYYLRIADYIMPYLRGRPQSLKRNPNGIKDEGFFHKDAGDEAPEWVESIKIFSASANKDIDYILCNDKATLAYLNNLGCIEINPWHSTIKALDYPDYLVIDIDPSEKNTFEQVIETANMIKEILDKAGAASYCKTSGATGLHVYVPLGKKYTYEQAKDFAYHVCKLTEKQLPDFTSLKRNLRKRGKKHIYLDYLQNRRGQTITAPYSLRPRPGAPVSMPSRWREVKSGLKPSDFNIHNAVERIKNTGDIFSRILGKGTDLEKCLERLNKAVF
ncbi:MAG TPA: DNA ligase D [Thermodesulfobacteriota bacterium]|nr:DNA ligase D [Thermodesulfobacteriota bacterium]